MPEDVIVARGTQEGLETFSRRRRGRWRPLSDKETLENITNQLVEMKNTSELAIDLAYSSLLLNNTFLAEEVQLLHQD